MAEFNSLGDLYLVISGRQWVSLMTFLWRFWYVERYFSTCLSMIYGACRFIKDGNDKLVLDNLKDDWDTDTYMDLSEMWVQNPIGSSELSLFKLPFRGYVAHFQTYSNR